jgi:hypothetical protein
VVLKLLFFTEGEVSSLPISFWSLLLLFFGKIFFENLFIWDWGFVSFFEFIIFCLFSAILFWILYIASIISKPLCLKFFLSAKFFSSGNIKSNAFMLLKFWI